MTILRTILMTTAFALPLVPLAHPVLAEPLEDVAQLDVIPGWQTQTGTHMIGFRVTLAPGWKTYWRAPGEAGIPPQFSWTGSQNIESAQFHWPVPEVIDQNGMQTIGYYDGLVLPVELSPIDSDMPIILSGEVLMGVCEDICVPVQMTFDATLPVGGQRDGAITASLLNQPLSATDAAVSGATCTVTPSEEGLEVSALITMPSAGGDETVVFETQNPEVWVSPTDVTRTGNELRATVDMVHVSGNSFALDRSAMRITILGEDYAVDVLGCTLD